MSHHGQTPRQSQRASRTNQPRQAASRTSQVSDRSVGLSRTPSADRQLLGALTSSPPPRGGADIEDDDDDSLTPTPVPNKESMHSQSRRSTKQGNGDRDTVIRLDDDGDSPSPAGYKQGSSGNSRNSNNANGSVKLASVSNGTKENDWQSGRSMVQCNEYMLKYEVLTDVLFMVGDSKEEVRAHKYVLMSRSPVLFKSLVKQLNNPNLRIAIPDMSVHVFRELLQYMYTDEFDIDTSNVAPMLFAAKKFQLKGLLNRCFQHLNAELDDDTVCKIMEQAHKYNENVLFEKCKRHILMNGDVVLKNGTVGELCSECVTQIVKSDELRANEENVYEACMVWANSEIKRAKRQATDESRREILGKLLYLIRFPIMDVTYFTQKVSLGNVLSHDETLSIFQYFHGELQQLPNRFSRNPRTRFPRDLRDNAFNRPIMLPELNKADMLRMRRFPGCDGVWKQNGPPDAISFRVSETIILYGIELYGVARGQETYSVRLCIYDDISREEVRKNESSIFTSTIKDTYDMFLSRPIRIPARRIFTIMVVMKGSPTRKGVDGESISIQQGVTIEFMESSRSSNGTGVAVGQIAGLLFDKAKQ